MTKPTILLVEDDYDLRQVVCEALELMGYSVTVAIDGRDAITKLEKGPYDVICSDLIMPNGVSGNDLAIRARHMSPNSKLILVSGYPRSELGSLPDNAVFLAKPYRFSELIRAIESIQVVPAAPR